MRFMKAWDWKENHRISVNNVTINKGRLEVFFQAKKKSFHQLHQRAERNRPHDWIDGTAVGRIGVQRI